MCAVLPWATCPRPRQNSNIENESANIIYLCGGLRASAPCLHVRALLQMTTPYAASQSTCQCNTEDCFPKETVQLKKSWCLCWQFSLLLCPPAPLRFPNCSTVGDDSTLGQVFKPLAKGAQCKLCQSGRVGRIAVLALARALPEGSVSWRLVGLDGGVGL